MKSEQEFHDALSNKKVPILVLDQKWHRLFAIHGKTEKIKSLELELDEHLKKQGQLNSKLKNLKRIKGQLMENIVENMDESLSAESDRDKKMNEDRRLINEINEQIEKCEDEILEIPNLIHDTNEKLMIESMDYCYSKIRTNKDESDEIDEWIKQIRIDLKKNIIRKQNRDINNREIYAYMHDILGASVLDIFDLKYDDEFFEDNKK